jgi:hypothetical protein
VKSKAEGSLGQVHRKSVPGKSKQPRYELIRWTAQFHCEEYPAKTELHTRICIRDKTTGRVHDNLVLLIDRVFVLMQWHRGHALVGLEDSRQMICSPPSRAIQFTKADVQALFNQMAVHLNNAYSLTFEGPARSIEVSEVRKELQEEGTVWYGLFSEMAS